MFATGDYVRVSIPLCASCQRGQTRSHWKSIGLGLGIGLVLMLPLLAVALSARNDLYLWLSLAALSSPVLTCAFAVAINKYKRTPVRLRDYSASAGTVAIRFRDQYLRCRICERAKPAVSRTQPEATQRPKQRIKAGGKSKWMKNFSQTPGPSLGKAIAISNATS